MGVIWRGGADGVRAPSAPADQVLIHTDAPLAQVAAQGKNFKWNRPICDCGCEKVWGHGYTFRFFDGLDEPTWLRRYRCPAFRRVFTMIPSGFGRRYRTMISVIWKAIEERLRGPCWPPGVSRQRGGHWLRRFLAICKMDFPEEKHVVVLDRLRGNGVHFF